MFLWFLAAMIFLIVVGSVYQAISAAADKRNFPPPGQMVSIGDRRIHLQITGENNGNPTILLAAGMGSFSKNW